MERQSFIFYRSFFEAISRQPKREQARIYHAVADYALNGTLPKEDNGIWGIFVLIKPQLDANIKRYQNGCKGGSKKEAGRKRNPTKGEANVNVNENKNENENKNGNEKENENGKRAASLFLPPALEEIQAYCLERNNGIDCIGFLNFYESKGWMIGKNRMKDWKAAVRSWEQRDKQGAPKRQGESGNPFYEIAIEEGLV